MVDAVGIHTQEEVVPILAAAVAGATAARDILVVGELGGMPAASVEGQEERPSVLVGNTPVEAVQCGSLGIDGDNPQIPFAVGAPEAGVGVEVGAVEVGVVAVVVEHCGLKEGQASGMGERIAYV